MNSLKLMILNQINLFQPVDYMRSPSKQVINRDIKTSMNLLLRNDTTKLSLTVGQEERRKISGGAEDICRELQLLGWRFRTSLPILKPALLILHSRRSSPVRSAVKVGMQQPYEREKKIATNASECKNMQDFIRSHPQLAPYEVQVELEEVQLRLPDAGSLPLGQIIYLLKEMMIGYDALIDIFGLFEPSDEMVAISSSHQWRVWLNEDYLLNCRPNKEANISERQFIYKLLFLAEKHCTGTSLSKTFFNELKEFTYNKECSFIRVLEKVKQFVAMNKIFQPNRVTLNNDKNFNDSMEIEKKKSMMMASNNSSFNNISPERRRFTGGIPPKSGFFQFQSKSSTNILGMGKSSLNTSVTMPYMAHRVTMNMSSNDLQKNSQMMPKNGFIFSSMKVPRQKQTPFLKASTSFKEIPVHSNNPRTNFMKPLSPPPKIQTSYTPNLFMSKSRHQLKALVNPKKQASPQPKQDERKQKKSRKYSQQLIKVKSLEALTSKKFAGSNIYLNDPQNRGAVNVIKANQQKMACKGTDNSSKKLQSPNYSSPSTGQMKDSKQSSKKQLKGQENYLSLKMNDLGNNKSRFNQSSYYGVGTTNEKANKNMAGSYSFYNKEQSSSQEEKNEDMQEKGSNKWTKKISGLFSDDASIKHLKGSVKFKTADEERFEKQYLKDVKLQMLEKFGRPVRHSIVDEQDDFDEPLLKVKNPYQSMQLIQQVLDDGKSHVQKQQQDDESIVRQVRKRNQTVQMITNIQQAFQRARSNKKECFSDFQSQQESFEQFGFESEAYTINVRK